MPALRTSLKRILAMMLVGSLAANVWLLAARVRHAEKVGASAPTGVASQVPAAPSLSLAAIESTDPAALRAAGLDETTVRAVIEGMLRRRLRDRLAEVRVERTRNAWWKAGRTVLAGDAKLQAEMVTDPLRRLLGPDPLDQADAECRYSFLPPEKRRPLGQIDRDYAELQARIPKNVVNTQLQAEANELKLLIDERQKDVLAALTPEEQADYNLRFTGSAGLLSRRAGAMGTTEAEFRAIKPLIDDFEKESNKLGRDEKFDLAAYQELQRKTAQQLVATLGYDRAVDYIWSGYDSEFSALRRATEAAQLPANTPAKVMELAVETSRQAVRVHDDATLTAPQKIAALAALQQTARAQLGVLLPAEARQVMSPEEPHWLKDLGEGRYDELMPSLSSSGGYMGVSVTSPPPPKRDPFTLIPPRPAGP